MNCAFLSRHARVFFTYLISEIIVSVRAACSTLGNVSFSPGTSINRCISIVWFSSEHSDPVDPVLNLTKSAFLIVAVCYHSAPSIHISSRTTGLSRDFFQQSFYSLLSIDIHSGLDLDIFCSTTCSHCSRHFIAIYCSTVIRRFAHHVPFPCFSSSRVLSTYPAYHRLNSCSLVSD